MDKDYSVIFWRGGKEPTVIESDKIDMDNPFIFFTVGSVKAKNEKEATPKLRQLFKEKYLTF